MLSRAAVLLTPLESSDSPSSPFYKHRVRISPLFATHTKTTVVRTNNSHSGTRSLPSRLLAPKAMPGHNVTGPSPLRIKSDAPCMARRFSRGRTSARFSGGDRDSAGLQREVRIGQSEWAIKGGSDHPFGGVLSGKLWIHPADLCGRQRPSRCPRFVPGAG